MRIERITGVGLYPTAVQGKNKNEQQKVQVSHQVGYSTMPNYGYGRDLISVRKNSPTFGANISKELSDLAQRIPLSERLASIFQIMEKGDLLVVGKDLVSTQKKLKANLEKLFQPIKREFFIKNDKSESSLAFFRPFDDDLEVWNLNDKDFTLRVDKEHSFKVSPGTSFSTAKGDEINLDGQIIKIKDYPDMDLSAQRSIFSDVYNFENDVQQDIVKMNKRTLNNRVINIVRNINEVNFSKVGGQDKAIEELKKGILYPLKYPAVYSGEDLTRGFILHGPAGTGKTELCRALANEAGIPYEYISGTSFQSKWVGESENNVREFFERLKANQPAIGIIDEIDAVGAERGDADVYGAKLVDQILTCMTDIYNSNDDVFIIGLTNKYASLDTALKRAERFSKHIFVGAPDKDGIKSILKIHTEGRPLDKDVNIDELADKMYSVNAVGSDIKYMTKLAKENMMKRLGIYEKMENGTFTSADIKNATITQEDLLDAVKTFEEQHRVPKRNAIGYSK